MKQEITKSENLKKIDALSKLKPGWNGSDGMPFSMDSIRVFKNVINALHMQPQIAPTGRNSLFMRFTPDMDIELFPNTANVLIAGMVEPVSIDKAAEYINRILDENIPIKATIAQ